MDRLTLFRALYLALGVALLGASVTLAVSPIRQLTNTSASNLRPAWSPDGRRIAFQSNRDGPYHIFVMDSDGKNMQQVTGGDVDDRHPAWSPDGKYLAIDSGDAVHREIFVIDVATRARTQITRLGAVTSFPSWSPEGKRIGFYVYQEGTMDLWTVVPNGSSPNRLTFSLANERNNNCTFSCHAASWSPDSGRIALSDGDQARVLVIPSQGGAPSAISPTDERSHFPVFLSDGRVVYVSEHVSQEQSWTDLWAIDPSAGGPRSEVVRGVQAQGPFALSPDGRELLFASPRSGNFEIYAVTLDDAGKAALAARPERASPATSRPATPRDSAPEFPLPTDSLPYGVAAALVVVAALGIELAVWLKRRRAARQ